MKKSKIIFPAITLFLFLMGLFILKSFPILTISQEQIDELTLKFDQDTISASEKALVKKVYKNMIFGGRFVSPEASRILRHYVSDTSGDLYLKSAYFYDSDFIRKTLDKNKGKKIIGPVTLKISEDSRIAYAVNGFYINSEEKSIYQHIDFAPKNDKSTYTYFEIYKKKLKIADRLVRIFEEDGGCKPFTVYISIR